MPVGLAEVVPAWAIPRLLRMEAEYCRIERWRGYLSSSFYVHLPDQTLESRSFRWRSQAPPPNDGAARAAYDELVGRVERAGWTRHADGADWFATTFTRFVETPKEVRLERVADVMPQERPPMRVVAPVQQSPRPPEPRPREPQPELRRPEPPTAPVRSRGRRWLAPAAVSAIRRRCGCSGLSDPRAARERQTRCRRGPDADRRRAPERGLVRVGGRHEGRRGVRSLGGRESRANRPPNRSARQRVVARDPSGLGYRPHPLQRHAYGQTDPALPRAEAVGAVRRGVEPDNRCERTPGAHPGHVREAVRHTALTSAVASATMRERARSRGAAVDDDRLTGDIRRQRGGEEDDGVCDLARRA